MDGVPETEPKPARRRLGAVAWTHDGCRWLAFRAGDDVPAFDDLMIRGALARVALDCNRIETLDRAFNRELWSLGYVASLETCLTDNSTVLVMIASNR
jgi:hypothetical protein